MPRGGKRQGRQGKAYPNRTDLNAQAVRTAPSQTYGDAKAQADAQRVVPLPQMREPLSPGPVTATPLNAPTARPTEPLTAGMPMGPGPGPGVMMPAVDPTVETLRAAVMQFSTPGALALLEKLSARESR